MTRLAELINNIASPRLRAVGFIRQPLENISNMDFDATESEGLDALNQQPSIEPMDPYDCCDVCHPFICICEPMGSGNPRKSDE